MLKTVGVDFLAHPETKVRNRHGDVVQLNKRLTAAVIQTGQEVLEANDVTKAQICTPVMAERTIEMKISLVV